MCAKWNLEIKRCRVYPDCDIVSISGDITQGDVAAMATHPDHGRYMFYNNEYFRLLFVSFTYIEYCEYITECVATQYHAKQVSPSTLCLSRVFKKLLNTMASESG